MATHVKIATIYHFFFFCYHCQPYMVIQYINEKLFDFRDLKRNSSTSHSTII